jgi:hypothetical protein
VEFIIITSEFHSETNKQTGIIDENSIKEKRSLNGMQETIILRFLETKLNLKENYHMEK